MALALFVLAILSLSGLQQVDQSRPLDALGILLIAVQSLSLAWRRRFPVAVLAIVTVAFMIDRGLNYPESWAGFGITIALYTLGAELEARKAKIIAGLTIVTVVAWAGVGMVVYGLPPTVLLGSLVILMFPFVLGLEAHRREQKMLELEARAIRAEMTQERDTASAVRKERIRIARELHDVVAHEMTVMTIQAAAAERIVDSDQAAAKRSMHTVAEAGHRGLTEMRRLLGLLRDDAERDLNPQPGLDSLESLVRKMNEAGLRVEMNVDGDPVRLPAGIDLSAYRIVQESLTNVAKHGGPGANVGLRLTYRPDELGIDVYDDGRGAAADLVSAGVGHGLIGMEERVALLNGSLSAGPRRGGGYRVRATIPIPER